MAAALPEYVPAGQIGVDAELIGKIAQLGCFKPEVALTAYSGETTAYGADITGMDGSGAATASARASISKASLVKYNTTPSETPGSRAHDFSPLTIASNIPEIQQRLGEVYANLREPKPWARQLNSSISEGLRKAARSRLLTDQAIREEAIHETVQMAWTAAAGIVFDTAIGAMSGQSFLDYYGAVGIVLGSVIVPNGLKALKRDKGETCFSLFPGYHIDRYAAVYGLTKARKLVRPIK